MKRHGSLRLLPIGILAVSVVVGGCWLARQPRVGVEREIESAESSSSITNPSESDFRPLRAPVLGFAIEHDTGRGLYRLVSHEKEKRELYSGGLEQCEEVLLKKLESKYGTSNTNWPLPTLGGKQFWGDHLVVKNWRIQENVFTGHFRLLDPDDSRRAWGTYEQCRVAFEHVRVENQLQPKSDHLVVLLHGLGRSKDAFRKLTLALETSGYEVASVNYPSTQSGIREHAEQLAAVLESSEGIQTVSFVTHSLGGIVIRDFLASDRLRHKSRPKIGRVVMLAPPNQGNIAAEVLQDWFVYQILAGEAGQQLTPEKVAKIPAPTCEFGVIAGGNGESGYNPLLEGDDDGLVTVENTRLEGMQDFLRVPSSHTFIMDHPRTIDAVQSFLKDGRFTPRTTNDSSVSLPTTTDQ